MHTHTRTLHAGRHTHSSVHTAKKEKGNTCPSTNRFRAVFPLRLCWLDSNKKHIMGANSAARTGCASACGCPRAATTGSIRWHKDMQEKHAGQTRLVESDSTRSHSELPRFRLPGRGSPSSSSSSSRSSSWVAGADESAREKLNRARFGVDAYQEL